jgi:hypothetical protein
MLMLVRNALSQPAVAPPGVALVGIELNPGPARGDGVATNVESTSIVYRATFAAPAVRLTFVHLGLTELAIGSRVCHHWHDSLARIQFPSLSIAGQPTRNRLAGQGGLAALFPPQLRPCFSKLTRLNLPHAYIGAAAVDLQLPRTLLSFTPYSIASTALGSVGSLTQLQCLHLHFRRQSERNIRVHASNFVDQLRSCRQLTELAVSHCAFFREDFEAMFQHHPWLSTLQLDDVCTHSGNQDTTMLQVLQHAPQLTSLSLRRLCGDALDSNLLHLRQCSSLRKLTLECQPHRVEQLRSLFMEPDLDHEQWSLIASGGFTVRSAQVSGRPAAMPSARARRGHRTRDDDSSSERPSKLQRLISSSASSSPSLVEFIPWPPLRRHLFLRSPSCSPWTGLSRLYEANPYASLDNGLRLEVDVDRCRIGEPLQFRVVAGRLFRRGEVVTWYGGLPVLKRSFALHKLPKTHARLIPGTAFVLDGLPLAEMLKRPVLADAAQLSWAAAHMNQLRPDDPSSPFTAAEVELWRSTPIGYMINTADGEEVNNVRIHTVLFADRTCEIPLMRATREIQVGEELMCAYHQF